jgi:calcineurin-like phosphoesterase family protein
MDAWYTADLHFGHRRISEYAGRPFENVDDMGTAIIERWNAVVAPGETVWVLGDTAMGPQGAGVSPAAIELVALLNGELVLVPGNHDACWVGSRKDQVRARAEYLAAGFADIIGRPDPVMLAGRPCRRSHFPYRGGGDHGVERYSEHRLEDRGDWLLCGHVHEKWRQRGRQINVGIDAWGGFPVHTNTLAELISCGPTDREIITW